MDQYQPKSAPRVGKACTRMGHVAIWSAKYLPIALMFLLAASVHFMRWQAREIDTPSRYARIQAQNHALAVQLAGLNRTLDHLSASFVEARDVATEARDLVGIHQGVVEIDLDPEPGSNAHPAWENPYHRALQRSGSRVDATLKQARELRISFEEMVAHMEREADEWACIPSTRPLEGGRLTSHYGRRRDPFTGLLAWHRGLDLSAPTGTPILASAEGRVIRAGYYRGYGRLVEMDHGNGLQTRYAHASRLAVKVGQWVKRGEIIGYVGSSGRTSAPHLHFEVHLLGEPVNPEPYILPDLLVAE